MKRVITSDAEMAGFLQSEIDRQGMIVVAEGSRLAFFSECDVTRSYAGVRVLL